MQFPTKFGVKTNGGSFHVYTYRQVQNWGDWIQKGGGGSKKDEKQEKEGQDKAEIKCVYAMKFNHFDRKSVWWISYFVLQIEVYAFNIVYISILK